jgi:hypothetical protein
MLPGLAVMVAAAASRTFAPRGAVALARRAVPAPRRVAAAGPLRAYSADATVRESRG